MSYKKKKPGIWKIDSRMAEWMAENINNNEIVERGGFYYDECPKCGASYIKDLGHECFDYLNIEAQVKYDGYDVVANKVNNVDINKTDLSTIEDGICKELKTLRKDRRITQETMGIYLAEWIGKDDPISKAQIYNYECGKNHITFPIFVGWCKVCDANPGEVLNKVVKESE